MSLSKQHLQRVLAQLEADIASLPAPKDLVPLIPAFEALGFPPVPNPLTPENGKVYLFEFLIEDIVIPLPSGVERGFCFELWGVELNNVGPYRLEVIATESQVVVGDCVIGSPVIASTQKFVIDGDGPSHEAVRLTFLGELDYTVAGAGIFGLWKMERLDDKSDTAKTVHYATAAALPAHAASGTGPDRVLAATGAGQLTIDGKTYTSIDREKILVKDELGEYSNGIYWLTQVDPWILRRAGIDQNDFQIDRRGALYQVWWGVANTGKQFFRKWSTSSIDQVVGGAPALPAYDQVQNEGSNLTKRTTIDFQGTGVTATDDGSKTVVTVPGAPSAYGTVQNEGSSLPQQTVLDFQGPGVSASDAGGKTVVQVPGGIADTVIDNTVQTTNSAPTPIGIYTAVGSNKTSTLRATVWARQSAGAAPFGAAKWVIEATLSRGTGYLYVVDWAIVYHYENDAEDWDVELIDSSTSYVTLRVIGGPSDTIQWRCQIEVSEHGF